MKECEKEKTEQKPHVRISVRSLVEFILRSGSLDDRGGGWKDKEAMRAGSRAHRKIQKSRGKNYQAEVTLRYEEAYADLILEVEGRADGIWTGTETDTVEEIKGMYRTPESLEEPVEVHLAQARCYAYMYGSLHKRKRMEIQMTYVNLETEETKFFHLSEDLDSLARFFSSLLDSYHRWASFSVQWKKLRDQSMKNLEFPFLYRPGQREMTVSVYRTISRGKQLFIQAPTGIGKTMAAVFPAVRALGEGKGEKLFYLTAKTITRTVAEDAFSVLMRKGLKIKTVTLTAKEKICACEEVRCNPETCPRADGHFDRVNDALYEMLTEQDRYGREEILQQSEKWNVCPFEFQLDLSLFMDAVICDYNYVFDPAARLKRFFGEGTKQGDWILLVDEAHNMVERGREMFSASLCREDFLAVRKLVKERYQKLAKALSSCSRLLLAYKKEAAVCTERKDISSFIFSLMHLAGVFEEVLPAISDDALRSEILPFYFTVASFLRIFDLVDEHYLVYTRLGEDGAFRIRLFCVNPAANIQAVSDRCRSTVFFSATLEPVRYYRSLLSTREEDYAVRIPSPFPSANRLLAIGKDVSSRYKRRTESEFQKIAEYIDRIVRAKAGNYMVFFPSYKMMQDVYAQYDLLARFSGAEVLVQTSEMPEGKREAFLTRFRKNRGSILVGFCVMGGVFSEGIDLAGESLIGTVIVGTGLPQISSERELLRTYYDRRGEDGFGYAYRTPGFHKVLQAAGRVIRTDRDRGVIWLLDERFCYSEYRRLFPAEWRDICTAELGSAAQLMDQFWSGRKDGGKDETGSEARKHGKPS